MAEKTERVSIRLTPQLKDQIQAAADDENRSITNYIENLCQQEIMKKGGIGALTNEQIKAAATIFAVCYKATGTLNSADITNAQRFPFKMASLYVHKLHSLHKSTPRIEAIIAEQYDKIDADTLESCFDVCLPIEKQGVWELAFSRCLAEY